MKPKTVAERATVLGMDQRTLVHAFKLLGCRLLVRGKKLPRHNYWGPRYKWNALLSEQQAADALGLDLKDVHRKMREFAWRPWTFEEMKVAMLTFYEREGRWPTTREYKLANSLPPYRQWVWRGGSELGVWNARSLDIWERLIARDRRCTPQMAIGFRNVLARKEAIDRIGFQTFLKKGIAELISEHPEYGALYRMPGETPTEPMVILKVINSTPEDDGTFADYYLRVPPDQTDVREAIKWTFNGDEALGSQAYEPLVET